MLEGEEVERVDRRSRRTLAIDRLELLLVLPAGIEVVDGVDAFALRLAAGEERELRVQLRCSRWGLYEVGALELRAPRASSAWSCGSGR